MGCHRNARHGTSADGGIGYGDRHAPRRSQLYAAELELGFTFQDKMELLLAARPFIVPSDERLATAHSHEDIDAERRQRAWDPDLLATRPEGSPTWGTVRHGSPSYNGQVSPSRLQEVLHAVPSATRIVFAAY